MRKGEFKRDTAETQVEVALDLDGTGVYDVETGIGFLDHMLEQLAKHSLIDLKVRIKGDLHVDMHHSTEDAGIAIGHALRRALDGKVGITRYASAYVSMDDALTRAAVDVSGRPYLVWNVAFTGPRIGEMDTELFREWFHAFAQNAKITLHVETLYGDNNHHIVESCYKALARALRDAVAIDPRTETAIPSTKGTLGDPES